MVAATVADEVGAGMSTTTSIPTFIFNGHEVALVNGTTTELPGGRVGYYQRHPEDCYRAAVATMTQVPYEELGCLDLPDLRYGKVSELRHWGNFHAWAHDRGEAVTFHHEPTGAEWAIGVGATVNLPGWSHVVVLHNDELFFNPSDGWEVLDGEVTIAPFRELLYAVTLEPKGT